MSHSVIFCQNHLIASFKYLELVFERPEDLYELLQLSLNETINESSREQFLDLKKKLEIILKLIQLNSNKLIGRNKLFTKDKEVIHFLWILLITTCKLTHDRLKALIDKISEILFENKLEQTDNEYNISYNNLLSFYKFIKDVYNGDFNKPIENVSLDNENIILTFNNLCTN